MVKKVADIDMAYDLFPDRSFVIASAELLADGWATWATGALLEAFRTATDKADLRAKVGRPLAVLAQKKVSEERIPAAVLARAKAARNFLIFLKV